MDDQLCRSTVGWLVGWLAVFSSSVCWSGVVHARPRLSPASYLTVHMYSVLRSPFSVLTYPPTPSRPTSRNLTLLHLPLQPGTMAMHCLCHHVEGSRLLTYTWQRATPSKSESKSKSISKS